MVESRVRSYVLRPVTPPAQLLWIACGDLSHDYLYLMTLIRFILTVMAVNGFGYSHGSLCQWHAQVSDYHASLELHCHPKKVTIQCKVIALTRLELRFNGF